MGKKKKKNVSCADTMVEIDIACGRCCAFSSGFCSCEVLGSCCSLALSGSDVVALAAAGSCDEPESGVSHVVFLVLFTVLPGTLYMNDEFGRV